MKNALKAESPLIPSFNETSRLVPVIAQDYISGEVLMLAWMNLEAWNMTIERGVAVYWSRSRCRLWEKGETSGNKQYVKEILLDCDRDTVLLKVQQTGDAACHTGRRSCFFYRIEDNSLKIISEPLFNPLEVYGPNPDSQSERRD